MCCTCPHARGYVPSGPERAKSVVSIPISDQFKRLLRAKALEHVSVLFPSPMYYTSHHPCNYHHHLRLSSSFSSAPSASSSSYFVFPFSFPCGFSHCFCFHYSPSSSCLSGWSSAAAAWRNHFFECLVLFFSFHEATALFASYAARKIHRKYACFLKFHRVQSTARCALKNLDLVKHTVFEQIDFWTAKPTCRQKNDLLKTL